MSYGGKMRLLVALFIVSLVGCDEPPPAPPSSVVHPPEHLPTGRSADRAVEASPAELEGPPAPLPPWPDMAIVPGRFSPEFAREYVALVNAERAAFDAEMATPKDPPKDANEAKHRIISEKGRRARLMNKPQLGDITDEQISDVVSFNPDMSSGEAELARLLKEHPQDIHICVDHGRWLQFRKQKEAAIAEYTRCGMLPDVTEDQRRYVQTQIAAVRSQH